MVLIGQIDILPRLVGAVSIPALVRDELDRARTPASFRAWIATPPPWLSSPGPIRDNDAALATLDDGERAAIALTVELDAQLVLIDDRAGVAAARARGFAVTGTLGLLDRAARSGLVDLANALTALRATNFHVKQDLLDSILAGWRNDVSR